MNEAARRPKAILVDMDETILVFDSVSPEAWRSVCDEFADRLDGLAQDELMRTISDYERWYWSDPVRHRRGRLDFELAWTEIASGAFGRAGVKDPGLVREITASYEARRREAIEPLPGAFDGLSRLQEQGLRLGLVTNGAANWQRSKIDRYDLARYFDCIVIEGELGFGKPDPRVFMHALDRLEASPEEAWMVGDNLEFDVGGAQAVGISAAWVDADGDGVPESAAVRPDLVVRSLPEFVAFLT